MLQTVLSWKKSLRRKRLISRKTSRFILELRKWKPNFLMDSYWGHVEPYALELKLCASRDTSTDACSWQSLSVHIHVRCLWLVEKMGKWEKKQPSFCSANLTQKRFARPGAVRESFRVHMVHKHISFSSFFPSFLSLAVISCTLFVSTKFSWSTWHEWVKSRSQSAVCWFAVLSTVFIFLSRKHSFSMGATSFHKILMLSFLPSFVSCGSISSAFFKLEKKYQKYKTTLHLFALRTI